MKNVYNAMRVLSLFYGMSCGQIALKEIGITPEVYYASEIDKFAIKQTQLNFPNTIQVGDVRDLNVEDLGHIDLILAGSPCTDMSFSGKRKGLFTVEGIEIKSLNEYLELKKQGFEFSGQSYLFWEFIRILNDVRKTNPDVLFLLENVKMGKKWEPVFDNAIGCKGNHINSALVSAQTRKRIYWTNIQGGIIPQPKDEGLTISDIAEYEVDEKYYLSEKVLNNFAFHLKRNHDKGNYYGANQEERLEEYDKLYGKFVWVTDMCLKDGKIRKVKARIEDCGGLLLADTPGRYTPYQIGDCAFESKEEALKHAEEQRTDLIKSLKLQIHELENLKFECDD